MGLSDTDAQTLTLSDTVVWPGTLSHTYTQSRQTGPQTDGVDDTLTDRQTDRDGVSETGGVGDAPPPPVGGGTIPTPVVEIVGTPSLIFDPKSQPRTPEMTKKQANLSVVPTNKSVKTQDHLKNVRLDTKLQAARYMDEALRVMVDLMRSAESEKIRKEAALDLIQMVMGKPSKPPEEKKEEKPQVIDVEDAVLEALLEDKSTQNDTE